MLPCSQVWPGLSCSNQFLADGLAVVSNDQTMITRIDLASIARAARGEIQAA